MRLDVDADAALKEEPHCNNCGASNVEILFRPGEAQVHQVVRCSACSLMYAYPLDRSNIERYTHGEDEHEPLTDSSRQVKHTKDKIADYRKIAPGLRSLLPEQGKLVEIGAYSGVLTDFFQRAGWNTVGIEPDGRAVEYARRKYGVNIIRGTLETAKLPPHEADAAVLLHVIEHIDDPKAAMLKIHELLRPGGIFVVETPTYDSLTFKMLGRRERSLSCNGHIFFYTEKTLTALLDQCGFAVRRVERVGRTMSVARMLWNLGVMLKSQGAQRAFGRMSDKLGLEGKYLTLNMRDMIRIYAEARPDGGRPTV